MLQTSFLTKCAQSIVQVAGKKVKRLGGNDKVASILLEQFFEKRRKQLLWKNW